jgi:uncharacterized protein GlcG (DUF336 family)
MDSQNLRVLQLLLASRGDCSRILGIEVRLFWVLACIFACLLVASIGCEGNGDPQSPCSGACTTQQLMAAEVEQIVAQAVAEAEAQSVAATISVLDRVGNVLVVFRMTGADPAVVISTGRGVASGLEAAVLQPFPSELAAISKAGSGAYLSSQGNAFTSRTASQILQENFNPGERDRAGGPLFGVQFSQLACGDFVRPAVVDQLGPKPLPLGIAADPGGLPLYKSGSLVGGLGVEVDGLYALDPAPTNFDVSLEERIATAGSAGFAAPRDRRADRIALDGRLLRFADDELTRTEPADADPFGGLAGAFVRVPGFFDPVPLAAQDGARKNTPDSGIMPSSDFSVPAEVLVDAAGFERFPPIDSIDPLPATGLSAAEVQSILDSALGIAFRARSQIRVPGGSQARVNISIVDIEGNVLGFARSLDAPVFGIDVSLQKARTAAFFSSADAAIALSSATDLLGPGGLLGANAYVDTVQALRDFLGDPTALANGIAFSYRAGGNLSRPFFPDGINGRAAGPLSRPFDDWSPFSTGLQLDLVLPGLALALCPIAPSIREFLFDEGFIAGTDPGDCPATPTSCTLDPLLDRISSGIQIFPGSVPIYRGSTLIGGIGISGDGVDQDDLVAFLGLAQASLAVAGGFGNAAPAIRADRLKVGGVNLRFVGCPVSPFLNGQSQNVCDGL